MVTSVGLLIVTPTPSTSLATWAMNITNPATARSPSKVTAPHPMKIAFFVFMRLAGISWLGSRYVSARAARKQGKRVNGRLVIKGAGLLLNGEAPASLKG